MPLRSRSPQCAVLLLCSSLVLTPLAAASPPEGARTLPKSPSASGVDVHVEKPEGGAPTGGSQKIKYTRTDTKSKNGILCKYIATNPDPPPPTLEKWLSCEAGEVIYL
ncbi:MAG: hypothetical protein KatS3mg124_2058 [Porticoccaceae bacterium]|nr:MAG: hypothetical protein KatS3mg124_2058 [Porticoccaceae bacterium]